MTVARTLPLACAALLIGGSAQAAMIDISDVFTANFTYSDTANLTGQFTSDAEASASQADGGTASANATISPDTGGAPSAGLVNAIQGSAAIDVNDNGLPGADAKGEVSYSFTYELVYDGGGSVDIGGGFDLVLDSSIENLLFASDVTGLFVSIITVEGGVDANGDEVSITFDNEDLLFGFGSLFDQEDVSASLDIGFGFDNIGLQLNGDFNRLVFSYTFEVQALIGEEPNPVPLPPTAAMLIAALGGLALCRRRR